MPEKIEITKEDGEIFEAEPLSYFTLEETNATYLVFTRNEVNNDGLVKVYVGKENAEGKLVKIEDENEWNAVKRAMVEIINGGGQ